MHASLQANGTLILGAVIFVLITRTPTCVFKVWIHIRNRMKTNLQFCISKSMDKVHVPIFLVKSKTNHSKYITATFWLITIEFPRHIIYMILPLMRWLNAKMISLIKFLLTVSRDLSHCFLHMITSMFQWILSSTVWCRSSSKPYECFLQHTSSSEKINKQYWWGPCLWLVWIHSCTSLIPYVECSFQHSSFNSCTVQWWWRRLLDQSNFSFSAKWGYITKWAASPLLDSLDFLALESKLGHRQKHNYWEWEWGRRSKQEPRARSTNFAPISKRLAERSIPEVLFI